MDEFRPRESSSSLEAPITGFFAGWWELIKGSTARPRGDQADHLLRLRRLAISQDEARAYGLLDALGSTGLGIFLLFHWDDWMKDHDILFGSRAFHQPTNWKGILAVLLVALGAHIVVTYFLAMFWYFTREA